MTPGHLLLFFHLSYEICPCFDRDLFGDIRKVMRASVLEESIYSQFEAFSRKKYPNKYKVHVLYKRG